MIHTSPLILMISAINPLPYLGKSNNVHWYQHELSAEVLVPAEDKNNHSTASKRKIKILEKAVIKSLLSVSLPPSEKKYRCFQLKK